MNVLIYEGKDCCLWLCIIILVHFTRFLPWLFEI